jgi:hypothetical protein
MDMQQWREQLILRELQKDEKIGTLLLCFFGVVIALLAVNLVFLNVHVLNSGNAASINSMRTISAVNADEAKPIPTATILSPTPIPIPESQTEQATVVQPVTKQSSVKEYFIPLGTGMTQPRDWTDVPGAQTTVDFGNYGDVKEIRFETAVSPEAIQEVSVRLFNVTDKHPVWYAENTTSGTSLVTSAPLAYDIGVKVYQVQMKTQLEFKTTLVLARLHITLQ